MINTDTPHKTKNEPLNVSALSNMRIAIFANASAAILFPFYLNALSLNLSVHAEELSQIILLFLIGLVSGILANLQLYFPIGSLKKSEKVKRIIWLSLFAFSMLLFILGTWKSVHVMLKSQNNSVTQAINYTSNPHHELQRLVEVEFTISSHGEDSIHFAVLR